MYKTYVFMYISPFSAYFSPHDIIAEKGPLRLSAEAYHQCSASSSTARAGCSGGTQTTPPDRCPGDRAPPRAEQRTSGQQGYIWGRSSGWSNQSLMVSKFSSGWSNQSLMVSRLSRGWSNQSLMVSKLSPIPCIST